MYHIQNRKQSEIMHPSDCEWREGGSTTTSQCLLFEKKYLIFVLKCELVYFEFISQNSSRSACENCDYFQFYCWDREQRITIM